MERLHFLWIGLCFFLFLFKDNRWRFSLCNCVNSLLCWYGTNWVLEKMVLGVVCIEWLWFVMNDHETMGKPVDGDDLEWQLMTRNSKWLEAKINEKWMSTRSIEQRSSWINSYQKTSVLRLKMSTTYPSMVLQYQKYTQYYRCCNCIRFTIHWFGCYE